jgi:hypothetical protein
VDVQSYRTEDRVANAPSLQRREDLLRQVQVHGPGVSGEDKASQLKTSRSRAARHGLRLMPGRRRGPLPNEREVLLQDEEKAALRLVDAEEPRRSPTVPVGYFSP